MTQADRNRLYNLACLIDNLPRVRVPKEYKRLRPLTNRELERARIQEKVSEIRVVLTEEELAQLADDIRECVANDGGAV